MSNMHEDLKRRLLKDLPFLEAGNVVYRVNGGFHVDRGETYYSTGGSSGNGHTTFSDTEEAVLDLSWDNPEWFEVATLEHITIVPKRNQIILRFKPLDMGDVEDLAKGIQHILPLLAERAPSMGKGTSYTWNKFKDITTSFSNN